jgi:uncharacterized protein
MRGSGGTPGGIGEFALGFVLAGLAVYLFLDSVVVTSGIGMIAGRVDGMFGGILGGRTSSGLVFVPFFIGVTSLFYDSRQRWGWTVMYLGIAIIVIEILSRMQFLISMKVSHLLGIIVLLAAGTGLMLRSYRDQNVEP